MCRMIEAAHLPALLIKAAKHLRITGYSLCQRFDRHFAPELLIGSAVDYAHSSTAELLDHIVLANALWFRAAVVFKGVSSFCGLWST